MKDKPTLRNKWNAPSRKEKITIIMCGIGIIAISAIQESGSSEKYDKEMEKNKQLCAQRMRTYYRGECITSGEWEKMEREKLDKELRKVPLH